MRSLKIKQSLALAAIISSTFLVACSSSSSGTSSSSSSGSVPAVVNVNVTGSAAKGIIVGGTVTAHPFVSGAIDYSTIIGTDTTDAEGTYSINISDHDGGPVAIRVVPATDGTTTMTCDLAAGCGDVAFGGAVPLTDSSFSLDAVVPSAAGDAISINVSVLTDIAASMAVQALAENTNTSTESIVALIGNSNSSVANRFSITGDITEIAIVDITDPAAVAVADHDVLEYNLYSAAIIEATLSATDITTVEDAVTSFAADYVAAGGIADKEDEASDVVTLEDILMHTSTVIEAVVANDTGSSINLGELITEVSATTADIETNGSTDVTDGSLDGVTGNTTELVKVKAMVDELRNLGTGVDLTDAESFQDQIDLASETFDSDAASVFEAMGMAVNAIGYAWEAYRDDGTMTTYMDLDSQLNVAITTVGTTVTYNVTSTINIPNEDDNVTGVASAASQTSVAVNLTAVDNGSSLDYTDAYTETDSNGLTTTQFGGSADIDFDISGTSISDSVSLTITKGVFKATASDRYEDADMRSEYRYTRVSDISNVVFDLEVALAETATNVTNPITFIGAIKLDVSEIDLTTDEVEQAIYSPEGVLTAWMYETDRVVSSGTVDVAISGGFSSLNGDEVNASLAVHLDGKGNAYTCKTVGEESLSGSDNSTETCSEETNEKFIGASMTLIFGLDVAGVSSDMSVELTGSRVASDVETLNLEMQYDDIRFDAEFDSSDQTDTSITVTITNQDNVIVTLTETIEAAGTNSEVLAVGGNVSLNGIEYATITDKNGFLQISYIDGSNTSL